MESTTRRKACPWQEYRSRVKFTCQSTSANRLLASSYPIYVFGRVLNTVAVVDLSKVKFQLLLLETRGAARLFQQVHGNVFDKPRSCLVGFFFHIRLVQWPWYREIWRLNRGSMADENIVLSKVSVNFLCKIRFWVKLKFLPPSRNETLLSEHCTI